MAKFNSDPEQELGEIARRGGAPGPLADMTWMEPRMTAFIEWLKSERTLDGGSLEDVMMLAHNFHLIILQMLHVEDDDPDFEDFLFGSAGRTFLLGCEDQTKRARAKRAGLGR